MYKWYVYVKNASMSWFEAKPEQVFEQDQD